MDPLIEALVRVAKEEGGPIAEDPRWRALADGTISDADRAALKEAAVTSDEAGRLYELLSGVPASARAEMASRAAAEVSRSIATDEPREAATPPPTERSRAPHRDRRRNRNLVGGSALAALAASIFAAVLWLRPHPGPLPRYELSAITGVQLIRSATSAASLRFASGGQVELILRPEQHIDGAVEFRAFVQRTAGVSAWSPQVDIAASGAVRVAGAADDILPAGEGEGVLVLFVGRPASIEEAIERLTSGGRLPDESSGPDLVVFQRPVSILPH